jgi:4-hydroxybenzoate polyprenyltransferase
MDLSSVARSCLLLVKSRIFNTFAYAWTAATGALMASRGSPPIPQFLLTTLSLFTMALSVYTYNDVVDAEMDRLNPEKKNRPYASGIVTRGHAMGFACALGLTAVTLSLLVSLQTALLCVMWLVLFLAYSNPHIYLKRKMILKEGTPAMGLFLSVLIGANSVGAVSPNVMFGAIFWGGLIFVSMPAFRDTTDLEEDRRYGVKSLASIMSWKRRLELAMFFIFITMTLTPLTYVRLGFNVLFPIVMVAMGLVMLRFMFPLLKGFDELKIAGLMKAGFAYMISMSMAMVLGSLSLPL